MAVVQLNPLPITNAEPAYATVFRAEFAKLADLGAAVMRAWRLEAMQRFNTIGLPMPRQEAWRNFPLRSFLNQSFTLQTKPSMGVAQEDLKPYLLQNAYRLVFVNGYFSEVLSDIENLQDGLHLSTLKSVLEVNPETLLNEAGMLSDEYDSFAALNAALFQDGTCLRVAADCHVEKPVQLLFISAPDAAGQSETPQATYLRNHIHMSHRSKLNLLIQHVAIPSLAATPHCHNVVQHVTMGDAATLEMTIHSEAQPNSWLLCADRAQLYGFACLNLSTVTVGEGISRHNIAVNLRGEGAKAQLNGLDILNANGMSHHETTMNHCEPKAQSDQFYKAVLDDESQAYFSGMVFVAPGADGTDSRQLNRNLLLSPNAKASTRPQLQINAHDVKCAHGATVGSLEEDQLFYLASRGLDRSLAQSLLTYGFAEEIILRIEDASVRHLLNRSVLNALHQSAGELRRALGAE
jgi:Fe-S cluster assembly protein SufD